VSPALRAAAIGAALVAVVALATWAAMTGRAWLGVLAFGAPALALRLVFTVALLRGPKPPTKAVSTHRYGRGWDHLQGMDVPPDPVPSTQITREEREAARRDGVLFVGRGVSVSQVPGEWLRQQRAQRGPSRKDRS